MHYDALIVGAGFAGSVVAEQLAVNGKRVLVIDKRPHIGGNAFDGFDDYGILIHKYGPHIFHTNSERIFNYLSKFTLWRDYEVRVLALVDNQYLPIPINRTTINKLYKLDLDQEGVKNFFEEVRLPLDKINTSEDIVLNTIGIDLYQKFFKGYIKKQWGRDASEILAEVAARIPTRTNDDDRYFTDKFQAIPLHGYTKMFEAILQHPNITLKTETNFTDVKDKEKYRHLVYTGPIDAYFDYKFGKLPYRSLTFEYEHVACSGFKQPAAVTSFPNNHDYTRITEFKQITGQMHSGTTIAKEYSHAEGDPYYPIPHPANYELYEKYRELAEDLPHVSFVGRLAQYRYYNMDQVVGSALKQAGLILDKLNLELSD